MLYVVVDSAHAGFSLTRSPDQTIKKLWQEVRRLVAENIDDVGMPLEQVIHSIVVSISVCSESKQISDDCNGRLEVTSLH